MADLTEQNILHDVMTARAHVGEVNGRIDQAVHETEQIVSETRERLAHLKSHFDQMIDHVKEQERLAADAASQVMQAFRQAGSWLSGEQARQYADLHALGDHAQMSLKTSEDAMGHFKHYGETLGQGQHESAALLDQFGASIEQERQQYDDALHRLAGEAGQWVNGITSVASSEENAMRDRLDHDLQTSCRELDGVFTQMVSQGRSYLDQAQHELTDKTSHGLAELTSHESTVRQDVQHGILTMQNALDHFGDLVGTTAKGLVHGADDAADLMNATNVGVRSVIHLFENLKQLLHEIESAWRG